MKYVAVANFAWHGKTYVEGDVAPGDDELIERGLVEPEWVAEELEEDGPVSGDYEGLEG